MGIDGKKGISYTRLVPPLIEAVKELKIENDAQNEEIEALRAENERMNEELSDLKEAIAAIEANIKG